MISTELPYPSIRKPVIGEAMVISSQPLASQAGIRVLEQGGNAVDAAIAAAATIAVVEPTNNSIGGDAFAQVWDGERLHGINASGRAPAAVDVTAFHGLRKMPERGWQSVTVPGAISAWMALSSRFGRLPFAQLMRSAINYAETGFFVSPSVAIKWSEQSEILRSQPGFAATFLPNGVSPPVGSRFRQPELAETLARIAESNGADFYRGETAKRIAAFARDCGADLKFEDLATHEAEWVEPLSSSFMGSQAYELPPNGQGVVALFALAILDRLNLSAYPVDSAGSIHLQVEAIKAAFAEMGPRIGQSAAAPPGTSWIDQSLVAKHADAIGRKKAGPFVHKLAPLAGTVYLAAGDAEGMMVSFIQSNYMGFGSGIVVPHTGVALQNRGACFSTNPESLTCIRPRSRPFHTILPGFLASQDGDLVAFGSTGGTFQPQGHVQIVARLIAYKQNPQAIVDAPRFKIGEGGNVVLEPGFSEDVQGELASYGHRLTAQSTSSWDFGGMQILHRADGRYLGGVDSRRDSHVAVA